MISKRFASVDTGTIERYLSGAGSDSALAAELAAAVCCPSDLWVLAQIKLSHYESLKDPFPECGGSVDPGIDRPDGLG